MRRDDYKDGLVVRLIQPLKLHCICDAGPFPIGTEIVLWRRESPNRCLIEVGPAGGRVLHKVKISSIQGELK